MSEKIATDPEAIVNDFPPEAPEFERLINAMSVACKVGNLYHEQLYRTLIWKWHCQMLHVAGVREPCSMNDPENPINLTN